MWKRLIHNVLSKNKLSLLIIFLIMFAMIFCSLNLFIFATYIPDVFYNTYDTFYENPSYIINVEDCDRQLFDSYEKYFVNYLVDIESNEHFCYLKIGNAINSDIIANTQTQFKRYYLNEFYIFESTLQEFKLEQDDILISEELASVQNIKINDIIEFSTNEGQFYRLKVAGTYTLTYTDDSEVIKFPIPIIVNDVFFANYSLNELNYLNFSGRLESYKKTLDVEKYLISKNYTITVSGLDNNNFALTQLICSICYLLAVSLMIGMAFILLNFINLFIDKSISTLGIYRALGVSSLKLALGYLSVFFLFAIFIVAVCILIFPLILNFINQSLLYYGISAVSYVINPIAPIVYFILLTLIIGANLLYLEAKLRKISPINLIKRY